jgi:hypothetical protein
MATLESYFSSISITQTDPRHNPSVGLSAMISPDKTGNFTLEVANGKDGDCLKLTSVLESKLGTVESRTMKDQDSGDESASAYVHATA